MLAKSLPYLSLALAVWLTFCPDAREYIPEIRITPRTKDRGREMSPVERMELFAEWSRLQAEYARETAGLPNGAGERLSGIASAGSGESRFLPENPVRELRDAGAGDRLVPPSVEELSLVPAAPPMRVTPENSRFKPVKTKRYEPPARPAPPPVQPARGDQLFNSMKQARLQGNGYASDAAMAAMAVEVDCEDEYVPLSAVTRRGRVVPFYAAAPYPELPAKGIYLWADGAISRESQTTYDNFHNPYRQRKNVYSAGIKKDWSPDSILGASVDILDSTVKSRAVGDFRENDTDGFVVNAHYDGTFLGKYPISLKGFYGRFNHEGGGQIYRGDTVDTWREDKHKSDLYGGSARIGLPLILGNDIRILPEIGAEYAELRSREYSFSYGNESVDVPEITSKSLAVPLTVTVRKEFLHPWGVFTPHLKGGLVKEFDDTAIGVRTFNSSSTVDGFVGDWYREMKFQTLNDKYYQIGAGFTARTVGGWEVVADYQRRFVRDWHDDTFTLELGRNF
ncbi:MAG: autotransporter outer membrane beta-barrel domain-containing protein [Planctomycetes bacterium]|nr:autotransporter outer membrane beta-barrel domain-containing protein [Planctomycetota bacterium]